VAITSDDPPAVGGEPPDDDEPGFAQMSLMEHLRELRRRIIISIVAVVVGATIAFLFYNRILDFLVHPYCVVIKKHPHFAGSNGCKLIITDPLEGFTTRLKVSGWAGLLLASPVVLFQFARFVSPGLHKREKKYIIPFVVASMFLFALGAVVALFTFPEALNFLIGVGGSNITTFFSPAKYLGLITLIILAFGAAFEFPIILVFLELIGVLPSSKLRSWRRPAVVVIFIVAAVITPSQDPYSLFAMAIPMYIFYEASIIIGRIAKK
jgi:sec-independent protein translocase protein TatC